MTHRGDGPVRARVRRRSLALLVIAVLLASATALVITFERGRSYGATAILTVGPVGGAVRSDLDALLGAQRLAITYAALARTEPVLSAAIERVHLVRSTAELSRQVSATSDESGLLMIRAVDSDPAVAADLANAVADATLVMQSTLWPLGSGALSVDDDLAALRTRIEALRSKPEGNAGSQGPDDPRPPGVGELPDPLASLTATYVDLLPMSSAGSPTTLSLLERAVIPAAPVATGPFVNAILAGLLALALGLLIVVEPVRVGVDQPGRRLKQAR